MQYRIGVKSMQNSPMTRFEFHNAGQGLFYSGTIGKFEFIYDCGSFRKDHLNSVLSTYKNRLTSKKVDLLILSHLHEDHVSGLYSLFHRLPKITVDNVMLPYLRPAERLLLAVGLPEFTGDWVYEFLADPVQFFIERDVKQVTYLSGGESASDEQMNYRSERHDEQSGFTDKLRDSTELKNYIYNNEPHLSRHLNSRLKIKSHKGALVANSVYWEFQFFNCSISPSIMQSFLNCVRGLSPYKPITELIVDPQERAKLRVCYNIINKTDFNSTSLIVLHRPLYAGSGLQPNRQVQLLTGDVNLKKHLSEMHNHFGSALSAVDLCLIPHHGSIRNWNPAILSNLSPKCMWVASTGIKNRTQPSLKILGDIKSHGHDYSICNDNSPVIF